MAFFRSKYVPDIVIVAGLLLLPLLFFAPVTLGGKTQIPADNLYQYEPWLSARAALGVPEVPHNALLSDLNRDPLAVNRVLKLFKGFNNPVALAFRYYLDFVHALIIPNFAHTAHTHILP